MAALEICWRVGLVKLAPHIHLIHTMRTIAVHIIWFSSIKNHRYSAIWILNCSKKQEKNKHLQACQPLYQIRPDIGPLRRLVTLQGLEQRETIFFLARTTYSLWHFLHNMTSKLRSAKRLFVIQWNIESIHDIKTLVGIGFRKIINMY